MTSVRSTRELANLLKQGSLVRSAPALAIPDLPSEVYEEWTRLQAAVQDECGCTPGTFAGMLVTGLGTLVLWYFRHAIENWWPWALGVAATALAAALLTKMIFIQLPARRLVRLARGLVRGGTLR